LRPRALGDLIGPLECSEFPAETQGFVERAQLQSVGLVAKY
jgi:hypothetical protein